MATQGDGLEILEQIKLDQPPGRVVVGMSGGVDSSVTAAVLKWAGFEVVGMTMQIWHRSTAFGQEEASAGCCTVDAVDDARRVARALDIPYYVPNFREPFSAVVDDFTREYAAGRTPNPCVRCNQLVRFHGLLQKASEVAANYVATGHYARVEFDPARQEYSLRRAVDAAKDQSYVLHTLDQAQLSRLLTPLGGLTKAQTRELARWFDLPVADKPDSQEICFVGRGDYRDFLRRTAGLDQQPGPIVDRSGECVGTHAGLHGYTVGQRKGLPAAADGPRFVLELRPRENTVVVGRREDACRHELECHDLHFTGRETRRRFRAAIRVRSHAPELPGTVDIVGGRARVHFDEPVWAVAPGQLAVFYEGDRVIGGGTIVADAPS
ncbi:MAG TPA: tRNA 2-thiouridine(34) synthase MnmA [Chloroflexota bacterium]|nr:tRNA 2-thiouridine(34) synthase MnmA [Chloroflexota bacterium]